MDEKQGKTFTAWLLLGGALVGTLLAILLMRMQPGPTSGMIGIGAAIASAILAAAALALAPTVPNEATRRQRLAHALFIAVALSLWVLFFGTRLGWTHILTLIVPVCTVGTIAFMLFLQRW